MSLKEKWQELPSNARLGIMVGGIFVSVIALAAVVQSTRGPTREIAGQPIGANKPANFRVPTARETGVDDLAAKLESIGADSITNDKGETYYLIRVRTEKSSLSHRDGTLPIIPGMVAEVDVITGAKTVMGYLTKPLVRMRQTAMRER